MNYLCYSLVASTSLDTVFRWVSICFGSTDRFPIVFHTYLSHLLINIISGFIYLSKKNTNTFNQWCRTVLHSYIGRKYQQDINKGTVNCMPSAKRTIPMMVSVKHFGVIHAHQRAFTREDLSVPMEIEKKTRKYLIGKISQSFPIACVTTR